MNFLLEEAKDKSNDIKIMNLNKPVKNLKVSNEKYNQQYNEISGFKDFKRESNYPKRTRESAHNEPNFKNPFENSNDDFKKRMDDPFASNPALRMKDSGN
jgi:hypothetical protein